MNRIAYLLIVFINVGIVAAIWGWLLQAVIFATFE